MNFQFASDLHLEHVQNKKAVLKKPLLPAADILLLAGDIMPLCDIHQHQDFLNYISDHFEMTYWLPGNHEYFGSDLSIWPSCFEECIRPNLVMLNNTVKQIEDPAGPIRLIFSTLWSHIPPDLSEILPKRMRDFNQIQWNGSGLTAQRYNQLHQEALEFLEESVSVNKAERNLVISHHLPSFLNYPKKHQKDPINAGFASNLDDFIKKTTPNAWIFGHHHSNIPSFLIGKTQMLTNQLGYVKYKEGSGFDRSATLKV